MSQPLNVKPLTSIVAIDRKGAIGCRNSLPWRLKSDLSFFKETTTSNTVIMGRKTYDSIGCCLPKRSNIVLSHSLDLFHSTPDCKLVHSIDEALTQAENSRASEVFVIGGAATYMQFADLIDRYLVTFVDHEAEEADAFLSSKILDDLHHWQKREVAVHNAYPGRDDFDFRVLELMAPDMEARKANRTLLINSFNKQSKKQTHSRQKSLHDPFSGSQAAFAF